MSRFKENWPSAKRYYGQALASEPENARALYGLAAVARDEGAAITARKYATRCHRLMLPGDDGDLKQSLLDLIAKNWHDLVEKH
jgi:hypothetical protein